MNFLELMNQVNNFDVKNKEGMLEIVNNININNENFNEWVENVFSEKINDFDMNKLPYLIDTLYQTNDKTKFMLCCMLLESTCDKLSFITHLENYPLFEEKFKSLVPTLVTVYEQVDNGVANCMSLIIMNKDPEFKYFNQESKETLIEATKRKLNDILDYLKTSNINPIVFDDLEIIVDIACYLKDNEISKIIDEIDHLGKNGNADLFIIKYKIINNLNISKEKVQKFINEDEKLFVLYNIMEKLHVNNIYLKDVSQEQIAKSDMIRWLSYPTELGSAPDKIELLGEFIFNNTRCFAFKFSKEDFHIKGDLLGVSGGYPMDKVSSMTSGYTFSKFEVLSENWQKQAKELVEFISEYWKNRANDNKR